MLEARQKAYEHYGIDPDAYMGEYRHGDEFCPVCRAHYTTTKQAHCDLELARAKDMDELGYPARFCFHCHKAYPSIIDRGAICPACDRRQARLSTQVERDRASWGTGEYVPDGLGCVEKLPRWSVHWNGNPDG